jgi:hypothetical protein
MPQLHQAMIGGGLALVFGITLALTCNTDSVAHDGYRTSTTSAPKKCAALATDSPAYKQCIEDAAQKPTGSGKS